MKISIEFDDIKEASEYLLWRINKTKTPLHKAGLSIRTYRVLCDDFEFIEDAQETDSNVLLKIPNLGKNTLNEIKNWKPSADKDIGSGS